MKAPTVRIRKKTSGVFFASGRNARVFLLLGLFLLVVAVLPAAARQQTIAVFPLEDLARGPNTPNFIVARYLHDQIAAMGHNTVLESDVLSFMGAVHWNGGLPETGHWESKNSS